MASSNTPYLDKFDLSAMPRVTSETIDKLLKFSFLCYTRGADGFQWKAWREGAGNVLEKLTADPATPASAESIQLLCDGITLYDADASHRRWDAWIKRVGEHLADK